MTVEAASLRSKFCCKKESTSDEVLFGAGYEARTRYRTPPRLRLRGGPAPPVSMTVEAASLCSKFRCKKENTSDEVLFGAGYEARTRYLHLGKVALYQMS